MVFTWLGIQIWICYWQILKKKGRGVDQKTSQYLVWSPFASCTVAHLLRIELIRLLIGACGNVVQHLFNGCKKLMDIGGNWNNILCMLIQSIPNMLNMWYFWWACRPWKNYDIFSFQELCTDPCDMGPCIIMLKQEVMAATMGLSSRYKSNCVHCP
jgi:hypothetical protein